MMNVIGMARESSWQEEGWAIPATIDEFARLYSDFHRDAVDLIYAISSGDAVQMGASRPGSRSSNTPKNALPCSLTPPIR